MDLPELLARAGIQPDEVPNLLAWARARSAALVTDIDHDSPLGQSLAPSLAQLVMQPAGAVPASMPSLPRLPSRESAAPTSAHSSRGSRGTSRVISKPYLGAAVEAALSGGETSGNLSQETAASPPPEDPPNYDDDASIGGFARLAFSIRRRPTERPHDPQALAHGFALQAERESSGLAVPAPPSFEASESNVRMRIPGLGHDSERSTSLVVGIPDDETADIPQPRGSSPSAGLVATASGSLRAARPAPPTPPPTPRPNPDASIELNLAIEDPELSSALMRMIPESGETSSTLTSPPMLADSEASLQIPIHVEEASRLLAPSSVLTGPASKPAARPKTPPPPPNRAKSAPAPQAAPQAAPEPEKRARGRKKVLELGAPVARPVSRPSSPSITPSRPTREVSKPEPSQSSVPNYLLDDDE